MREVNISIGEVKRDISQLVNRVAYGGDRILLTSRGKPKAVLISIADYERLKQQEMNTPLVYWNEWLEKAETLSKAIRERHGADIALETLAQLDFEDKQEREERDDERSSV